MSGLEILSLSADGCYQVQAIALAVPAANHQYPKRERGVWLRGSSVVSGAQHLAEPTRVELKLRKYPGHRAPLGLMVIIECALRTAEYGDDTHIDLARLESTLEGMFDLLG